MKNTGVFCTKEELKELRGLISQGYPRNGPMCVMSCAEGIRQGEYERKAMLRTHELAREHGLPEVQGYYGVTQDGEFVTTEEEGS